MNFRPELGEQLNNLLQEIQDQNLLVIVEGKKDKQALQHLGIQNVITLNKAPFQLIEELASQEHPSEIIILTDFDEEGKSLYGKLSRECRRNGLRVNDRLRRFLMRETPVAHIEGLATFVGNLPG